MTEGSHGLSIGEVFVLITMGLLALLGLALKLTPDQRMEEIRPGCLLACAPLLTTIPMIWIAWMFQYARYGDDGLKHSVPQFSIQGLFLLGLILGIFAVVRARGMRFLVASAVALGVWISIFVAVNALVFVGKDSLWPMRSL